MQPMRAAPEPLGGCRVQRWLCCCLTGLPQISTVGTLAECGVPELCSHSALMTSVALHIT